MSTGLCSFREHGYVGLTSDPKKAWAYAQACAFAFYEAGVTEWPYAVVLGVRVPEGMPMRPDQLDELWVPGPFPPQYLELAEPVRVPTDSPILRAGLLSLFHSLHNPFEAAHAGKFIGDPLAT